MACNNKKGAGIRKCRLASYSKKLSEKQTGDINDPRRIILFYFTDAISSAKSFTMEDAVVLPVETSSRLLLLGSSNAM